MKKLCTINSTYGQVGIAKLCGPVVECSPQSHELHPRIPLARDHDDHLLHLTHLHHQSQQLSDIHLATFLDLEQGTNKSSRMTMFPPLKGVRERVTTAFPHYTAHANWEQHLRNRLKMREPFLIRTQAAKPFPSSGSHVYTDEIPPS